MEVLLISDPRPAIALPGQFVGGLVPLTSVAWDSEFALVVDMGEQRTGGYAVQVVSAEVIGPDRIHLTLDVTRPGRGTFVTQAFTRPYTVARIARTGLRSGEVTVTAQDPNGAQLFTQVVRL